MTRRFFVMHNYITLYNNYVVMVASSLTAWSASFFFEHFLSYVSWPSNLQIPIFINVFRALLINNCRHYISKERWC